MTFQHRPNFIDRSGQAFRVGVQMGYNLLDSATHMFPRNGRAFIAGLRKALFDRENELPEEPQRDYPTSSESPSLRDVNLALKRGQEPEPRPPEEDSIEN